MQELSVAKGVVDLNRTMYFYLTTYLIYLRLHPTNYEKSHPFGNNIIGSHVNSTLNQNFIPKFCTNVYFSPYGCNQQKCVHHNQNK
jgi:hypothetical protein